jgi:hypothetical protein
MDMSESLDRLLLLLVLEEELGLQEADPIWEEAKAYATQNPPPLRPCDHYIDRICAYLHDRGVEDPRLDAVTIWITRRKLSGQFRGEGFSKQDLDDLCDQLNRQPLSSSKMFVDQNTWQELLAWSASSASSPSPPS